MNFVYDQGIHWHHLGTDNQHNAWDPMSEDVVVQALGVILDTNNYPLMIMCNLGRHRTGAVPPLGGRACTDRPPDGRSAAPMRVWRSRRDGGRLPTQVAALEPEQHL